MGPRAGLNDVKRKSLTLPGLETRLISSPVRSQLLSDTLVARSRNNFELQKLPTWQLLVRLQAGRLVNALRLNRAYKVIIMMKIMNTCK
jgi:hypothetical protein